MYPHAPHAQHGSTAEEPLSLEALEAMEQKCKEARERMNPASYSDGSPSTNAFSRAVNQKRPPIKNSHDTSRSSSGLGLEGDQSQEPNRNGHLQAAAMKLASSQSPFPVTPANPPKGSSTRLAREDYQSALKECLGAAEALERGAASMVAALRSSVLTLPPPPPPPTTPLQRSSEQTRSHGGSANTDSSNPDKKKKKKKKRKAHTSTDVEEQ
ncbi:hypothetical protein J1614_001568 [Plenodomus biglobosus]|nr:hypothetical protein J1614_001568 [Plenodomus biglobosus]